jgi:hypothetical protein
VAAPEPAAPIEPVADEAALPEASDGAPPGPAEGAAPPVPPAASPSRLAAEVALVDRARGRLFAGDHVAALAALAEYHQQFAGGDLDAEADVVMIETLIAMREAVRARALGAAFLVRFPRSPLAKRVHSLLERLPN